MFYTDELCFCVLYCDVYLLNIFLWADLQIAITEICSCCFLKQVTWHDSDQWGWHRIFQYGTTSRINTDATAIASECQIILHGKGTLLLTWINFNIWARMSNCIHWKWDGITNPFPNLFRRWSWEWISDLSHKLLSMWLLIRAGIKVKPC